MYLDRPDESGHRRSRIVSGYKADGNCIGLNRLQSALASNTRKASADCKLSARLSNTASVGELDC